MTPAAAEDAPPAPPSPAPSRFALPALGLTTLLGALLLFQVQPLIAQAILPWFGGTPAVWTMALLFFQTALVAGYAYVYVTARWLPPASRTYLHVALALGCLATLPILPSAAWKPAPDVEPTWHVFALLAACVGAPFVLLATTGPLLQLWYHRASGGRSPYRLYALSNVGSLVGLLAYPFVVEPWLDLPERSLVWSGGFALYVALTAYCAWRSLRPAAPAGAASTTQASKRGKRATSGDVVEAAKPTWRSVAVWLALSAGGTLLLLVTTNYVSQDLPSGPLVWILPLALYLASFIICFDHPRWYRPAVFALVVLVAVPVAATPVRTDSVTVPLVGNLVMLFAACMLCHGELARRKPAAEHLAGYFLCVAVGGALGGAFVAVVAPRIYERYWEWFGVLLGAWLFASTLFVAVVSKAGYLQRRWLQAGVLVAFVGGLLYVGRILVGHIPADEILSARNTFGVVSIQDLYNSDRTMVVGKAMRSGTTRHGMQVTVNNAGRTPTSYYSVESGVGRALLAARDHGRPIRVGVVGLGVGTLATYGRPRDVYRFYEINPLVVELAGEFFTYLKDSPAECSVALGDARLVLEREDPQSYDLLVLDAFSSDAVPTHLLTAEAFEIYLRHVVDDGIIAVHISNRFLDLAPVLAAAAQKFGLTGLNAYTRSDGKHLTQASYWVLLTRRPQSRWWLAIKPPLYAPLAKTAPTRLWTDSYSNLLPLLK